MIYKKLLIGVFIIQWNVLFIIGNTTLDYIISTIPLFISIYIMIDVFGDKKDV